MSQERPARRNIRGPARAAGSADSEAKSLQPWGPDELRALREQVRADAAKPDREPWDLVVIGAGITGAGIARDAAMRGLSVLVLEAHDVAFGTSSRSSRLIHGGVRYLEQGELGLVYEALRERARLYQTAGHLVRPARFLFPAYDGDRLPLWKLRVGLSLYDALSLFRASGHVSMDPHKTRALEPLLAASGLRGAVLYEDAITDDARLTLTTLQSARRHGARVLTYAPVERVECEPSPSGDGDATRLHVAVLAGGDRIHARQLIVATGPWTSERLLGAPGRGLLSLSQGIHLVLRADDVPVRQPLVLQARGEERRILFVIPWGARTYLGTTDTQYTGDPGRSGVTPAELESLLTTVQRHLPDARLAPERVISAWSGVRPLVRARGSGSTVELSRKHQIIRNEDGVLAVVGGKLTTYRAMAEEAVDRTLRSLPRRQRPPCRTHLEALVPGEPLTREELDRDPVLADLAPRHGPDARLLARRLAAKPALAERLVPELPYRWVEVEHALEFEGCTHLDDLLRRRLPLALTDPALGAGVARRVAARLVEVKGGGGRELEAELARYAELIRLESGREVPRAR
ncbi:MAG: glycerol-3-phosphate dehydrogenase/oxidase [Myxococcales bacterium]|nr:glycerol-3-phosphate dehydrogenase/oxidase [Myxococcales bacterium]MCB9749668.1 glycerol-3-phosphate dehydrogenase/oxidase [Myxococcales bacterium]